MNSITPIEKARHNPINTVPRESVPQIAENHTIQSGDTLSVIVREYLMANGRDFSARSIYQGVKLVAQANNIENADRIFAGQKITVNIPSPRMPESFPDVLERVAREKPQPVETGIYTKVLDGSATLTSTFGMRTHPIHDGRRSHNGMDLAADRNASITSMRSGRVTFSGWQQGHGNTIVVQHTRGVEIQYSHAT
jgi:murein DD-endopeptidase MepM/ murein hydrolase activator NlpD